METGVISPDGEEEEEEWLSVFPRLAKYLLHAHSVLRLLRLLIISTDTTLKLR